MKNVLVLGASGGMGSAIVKELVSRRVNVVAFARREETLTTLFGEEDFVQIYAGDVADKQAVLEAAKGVDVMIHAVGLPYQVWDKQHLPILQNVLDVATQTGARFVLVDNVYAYGRVSGQPITEETPKRPHTKKGAIRLQMEKMIEASHVSYLIVHFPDFYGPNATSGLLDRTFRAMLANQTAYYVGDQQIAREFIYTPDGAKALVILSEKDDAYNQHWHVPGAGTITGKEIIAIVKEQLFYKKKVKTATKRMIRLLGIFNPMMREYVEMFYLNEQPLILNGQKYQTQIGSIPQTDYEQGIKQTIAYMKQE